MIFDSMNNYKLYAGLGSGFKKAFEFITENQFEKTAPGRYPMKGGMYYMVQNYETKPESEGFFEAHRKFIDLQYVIKGKERHDYAHLSLMKIKGKYDEEKDMAVYTGKGSSLILNKGFFVIYFPEDVHMPNIRTGSAGEKNIKVVVKIPVR